MMKFKVGDSVITTRTYRRQGTVMFYEDKRGKYWRKESELSAEG